MNRITLYTAYSVVINVSEVKAWGPEDSWLPFLQEVIGVVQHRLGKAFLGGVYDQDEECLIITTKHMADALDLQEAWGTVVDIVREAYHDSEGQTPAGDIQ